MPEGDVITTPPKTSLTWIPAACKKLRNTNFPILQTSEAINWRF